MPTVRSFVRSAIAANVDVYPVVEKHLERTTNAAF